MNKQRIPISEAKRISKLYGQTQVIIVTWDRLNNRQHVVTYGQSLKDCEQAALCGNFVKKALGWPKEQCHAEPARVRLRNQRNGARPGESVSPIPPELEHNGERAGRKPGNAVE
jgi:hypothetical protein